MADLNAKNISVNGKLLNDDDRVVSVRGANGSPNVNDVLLVNTMPQAEYMYGCCPTAVAMLLGYYDLYGYSGKELSNLIDGDVEIESRGTDDDKYNMNAFDTVLGRATATEDFVYRFFSRADLDDIIEDYEEVDPTTPEEELEYSFVNNGAGPDIRIDVWNCLADYLGTGQFWRDNENLSTGYMENMLEQAIKNDDTKTIESDEGTKRTVEMRFLDFQYGLYLYVKDKGYDLDMKVTGTHSVDVAGGDFTFEDYKKEIDAGRPVLVLLNEHIMTGYGYNAETQEIIFDDCYEADQRMTWGGIYDYADEEHTMEAITTIGFMTADYDIDLAVVPIDGATEKLIVSTTEDQNASADYCFYGDSVFLSFAATNLGTSDSGDFNVTILINDDEKIKIPSISIAPNEVYSKLNISMPMNEFGTGLFHFRVELDSENTIQELAAINNIEERSLMVLMDGTNIVAGIQNVASGEVSSDDYVMNGAELHVLKGGTADGTMVQGKVTSVAANGEPTFTSGIVNVASGGLVQNAIVYEFGKLEVSGRAEDFSVFEYGETVVCDGGIASNFFVEVDGSLTVEAGGTVTGFIYMQKGAEISFEEGAILNFDLTQEVPEASALLEHYDYLTDAENATLTATVAADQAPGIYVLATCVEDFSSDVTLKCLSGDTCTDIETLEVDETSIDNEKSYTLLLDDDNNLKLQISAVKTVTNPAAGGEGSFDKAIADCESVVFDPDNTTYNYTDGLTATHDLSIIGNDFDETTLVGGNFYMDSNEASFRDLTLDGQVFGGARLTSGSEEYDGASLSFSSVVFTDGKRIYGGADVSGSATASLDSITLEMEDVDGDNARIFGAGKVADNAVLNIGDITIKVSSEEDGTFCNLFAGADVASDFKGSVNCGKVTTTIDGGEFTYCGNGSQLRGGESTQEDSTLTINHGTFNHYVYAGAFSMGGKATVDGDTTLVIKGGTFATHVFGGCGANNSENGANTLVSGSSSILVNASDEYVEFDGSVFAGSMGKGVVNGRTAVVFMGYGSNLSFETDSYVSGNSQMFRGGDQLVGGTQTLAFDSFYGNFGANINNGFSKLAVSDSNVMFAGNKLVLSGISEWEIEVGSKYAELSFDHGKNNFKGDTLTLTLAKDATPDSSGWEVIEGTSDTLRGWNSFSSVTLCGESATYTAGEWTSANYRFFKEDNTLKLATIA